MGARPINAPTIHIRRFINLSSRELSYRVKTVNRTRSIEVNEAVKYRPKSDDKSPVHGAELYAGIIVLRETALARLRENDEQPQRPAQHVRTVTADQRV